MTPKRKLTSKTADSVRVASGLLLSIYLGVAVLSGAALALVWSPSQAGASTTVAGLEGGAALLRSIHAFSAGGLVIAALLHFAAILAGVESPAPRPGPWRWGVACFVLVVAAAFTGRILPFDEHGGVSLGMAGAFFGLRAAFPEPLGGSGAQLGGVLLAHVVAGIAAVPALLSHARPWTGQSAERGRAELGRLGAAIVAAGAFGLALAAVVARPSLGPAFVGLDVTGPVSAVWHLRWLQVLSEQHLALAQAGAAALVAFGLTTPRLAARLGWPIVRAVWIGVLIAAAGVTASTYV